MRNTRIKSKRSFIANIVNYINDNIKNYIFVAIIFIIGIIFSIIFINNLQSNQRDEISTYITNFTTSIKDGYKVDNMALLTKSIWKNIILCIIMWFAGSTVIGIPIVLGIVAYRGFCIGYTVSSLIVVIGTGRGVLFFVSAMLLQNILIIPCILSLAVSGMKLYKSIMKDRRKENIKIEIIRHTIFSLIMLAILCISSLVETYISTNILTFIINFF